MAKCPHSFQVFVKPTGPVCNMRCRYCYYLDKKKYYPGEKSFQMPGLLLEEYIVQHIEASSDEIIRFSWHGGEPTLLGLDFFRRVLELQNKHQPVGQLIVNGLQTNGLRLDNRWGEFLSREKFSVGLSLDGPRELHDRYRRDRSGRSTFSQTLRGYDILKKHGVSTDILCVVHEGNVRKPLEVYNFFKEIGATYISFLPLVAREDPGRASKESVPGEEWGDFLIRIFDQWVKEDIGRIKVQIFEEAARWAFGLEHSLCIFRRTCGDIPVVEYNGDFYACDHYVDSRYCWGNIIETPLEELLMDPRQRSFGMEKEKGLPAYCRSCRVLAMCNGGCPRNRFVRTPDGESGLNYLCPGYKKFFTHCLPFVDAVRSRWQKAGGSNRE